MKNQQFLINTPLQRGAHGGKGITTASAVSCDYEKPLKRFVLFRARNTPLKRGVNEILRSVSAL
jgi:hypothetical protein